jgi:hypothetical protein
MPERGAPDRGFQVEQRYCARCATSRAGSSGGRRRTGSSWCLTVERCRRHGSAGTASTAAIERDESRPPTGRVSQPGVPGVRDALLAHVATSDRRPRHRGGVHPVRTREPTACVTASLNSPGEVRTALASRITTHGCSPIRTSRIRPDRPAAFVPLSTATPTVAPRAPGTTPPTRRRL